jgi:hypothetical protein
VRTLVQFLSFDRSRAECGAFHFGELAAESQSVRSRLAVTSEIEAVNMPSLERVTFRAFVRGTQWIAKFREQDANEVDVFLAGKRAETPATSSAHRVCLSDHDEQC